jgi:sulfur carrier protein
MIEIELNGAPHAVPAQHTLAQLVEALQLGGQALARHHLAVDRQRWPQVQLRAQDQVDIVRAIGGG